MTAGDSKAALTITPQPALAPSPQPRPAPTARALPPGLVAQVGQNWTPIVGQNWMPIDIQSWRLPESMRKTVKTLISPLAVFVTIIICLRSWRSAQAPASGPQNTKGIVNPRLKTVKANASSGFCSGAG